MPFEAATYLVALLLVALVILMMWTLVSSRAHNAAVLRFLLPLGGTDGQPRLDARIDGIEKRLRDDGETSRRAFTELDQGLRKEISTGAKEGLTAAFDKVQEGTKAQSDELARFGNALFSSGVVFSTR
jgi:hypothetical protein